MLREPVSACPSYPDPPLFRVVARVSARAVLASGPVFISYRQSDGSATAVALAWLLRAVGIPVWQDQTDLPPGDTESRLDEALAVGLSGGCLVVTPDIAKSGVVRTVELPRLYALASDPDFSFVVANAVRTGEPGARPDYRAPDRLLGQPGTLSSFKQYAAGDRAGLVEVAAELLDARAAQVRARRADGPAPLLINLQTRLRPESRPDDGADLSVRLRPAAHGRLPHPDGLVDLQDALRLLPRAVARSGVAEVRVSGGAHLSVAFALGTSLPTTLLPGLTVVDGAGGLWSSGPVSSGSVARLTRIGSHGLRPVKDAGAQRDVLAYVDLVPGEPSNAAFTRLLDEHEFDAHEQILPTTSDRLDPTEAGPLVEEIAGRLRALVQRHDHARLHLLLRCPFPVAVLLGRLCNTLRVVVYEWDDTEQPDSSDARPRYVATMQVQPTQAHGPVTDVLLASTDTTGSASAAAQTGTTP